MLKRLEITNGLNILLLWTSRYALCSIFCLAFVGETREHVQSWDFLAKGFSIVCCWHFTSWQQNQKDVCCSPSLPRSSKTLFLLRYLGRTSGGVLEATSTYSKDIWKTRVGRHDPFHGRYAFFVCFFFVGSCAQHSQVQRHSWCWHRTPLGYEFHDGILECFFPAFTLCTILYMRDAMNMWSLREQRWFKSLKKNQKHKQIKSLNIS